MKSLTTLRTALATSAFALIAGCMSVGPASPQLVDARRAFAEANASQAPALAPNALAIARQSLNDAELSHRAGDRKEDEQHLAYLAQRRAQIAISRANAEQSQRDLERNNQTNHITVVTPAPDNTARDQLALTNEELAKRNAELAAKGQQLDDQSRKLDAQQAELASKNLALETERQARIKLEAERDAALLKVKEFALVVENERGTVITLGGALLFRSNEATLLSTAKAKLDQVAAALLSVSSEQSLVVEGYADSRGADDLNLRLSAARAESVRAYLVAKGVAATKIVALGKGEANPIASNVSAEGRANNRRVEIVISRARQASVTK